jgi:hypothetical protein
MWKVDTQSTWTGLENGAQTGPVETVGRKTAPKFELPGVFMTAFLAG